MPKKWGANEGKERKSILFSRSGLIRGRRTERQGKRSRSHSSTDTTVTSGDKVGWEKRTGVAHIVRVIAFGQIAVRQGPGIINQIGHTEIVQDIFLADTGDH
jgi:hypothetical protein